MHLLEQDQTIPSSSRPREWWREKCKDLYFLCRVVLRTAFDDKFHDMGLLHKHLCDFLDMTKNPNRKKLVIVFRGSYKTTVLLGFCILLFVWSVANGTPVSIVYNTGTRENAENFSDDFRHVIQHCSFLKWIFPEIPDNPETSFRKWTKWKIELKSAKFHVASLDTKQVSRHYTVILNDDLVNDDNAFSEVERENVKRKFKFQKSILTRYKKRQVGLEIDTGTPYHPLDLMGDLLQHSKKYDKFIVPYAIPILPGQEVDLYLRQGILAFPEMYCWEDFEDILEDQGPSIFGTQYELRIIDEGDRLCRSEWIRQWKLAPESYQRLLIVDPGGGEKDRHDPSGFLVCDVSNTGHIYIHYAKKYWLYPSALLDHAFALSQSYRTDEVYFDKERLSTTAGDLIEHRLPLFNFSIYDHKNKPSEKRIYRLKQWLETGKILFNDDCRELESELLTYPSKNDHLLVCLAAVLDVMNPPKSRIKRVEEERVSPGFEEELQKLMKWQNRGELNDDIRF